MCCIVLTWCNVLACCNVLLSQGSEAVVLGCTAGGSVARVEWVGFVVVAAAAAAGGGDDDDAAAVLPACCCGS